MTTIFGRAPLSGWCGFTTDGGLTGTTPAVNSYETARMVTAAFADRLPAPQPAGGLLMSDGVGGATAAPGVYTSDAIPLPTLVAKPVGSGMLVAAGGGQVRTVPVPATSDVVAASRLEFRPADKIPPPPTVKFDLSGVADTVPGAPEGSMAMFTGSGGVRSSGDFVTFSSKSVARSLDEIRSRAPPVPPLARAAEPNRLVYAPRPPAANEGGPTGSDGIGGFANYPTIAPCRKLASLKAPDVPSDGEYMHLLSGPMDGAAVLDGSGGWRGAALVPSSVVATAAAATVPLPDSDASGFPVAADGSVGKWKLVPSAAVVDACRYAAAKGRLAAAGRIVGFGADGKAVLAGVESVFDAGDPHEMAQKWLLRVNATARIAEPSRPASVRLFDSVYESHGGNSVTVNHTCVLEKSLTDFSIPASGTNASDLRGSFTLLEYAQT